MKTRTMTGCSLVMFLGSKLNSLHYKTLLINFAIYLTLQDIEKADSSYKFINKTGHYGSKNKD